MDSFSGEDWGSIITANSPTSASLQNLTASWLSEWKRQFLEFAEESISIVAWAENKKLVGHDSKSGRSSKAKKVSAGF